METKDSNGFIKNRYYPGKLLCSEDFIIEQNYIQKKFNAVSQLFFGSGIITGLMVRQMNDNRICIAPGSFLDEKGRIITVEEPIYIDEPQLLKLKEIDSDYGLIVLKYIEEDIDNNDKTFEPLSNEKDKREYRYRRESFKVSIEPMEHKKDYFWFREHFFSDTIVYEDSDLKIIQSIPLYIPLDCEFKIELRLIPKHNKEINCAIEYYLRTEGFLCRETKQELRFYKEGIALLAKDYVFSFHLYYIDKTIQKDKVCFSYQKEDIKISLHNKNHYGLSDYNKLFTPLINDSAKLMKEKVQNLDSSLLMKWNQIDREICLGAIVYKETNYGVKIDKIITNEVRKYASVPYIENITNHLLFEYGMLNNSDNTSMYSLKQDFNIWYKESMEKQMKSGIIKIDIPSLYQESDVLYSAEIHHGLTQENVHVMFGIENFIDESYKEKEIIFGNQDLFHNQKGYMAAPKVKIVEKAVRIYPSRGTFQLAIKVAVPVYQLRAILRWFAYGI